MQADQRYCLRFGDARGAVLAQGPGDDEVGAGADPQRVGIEQRGVVVHDLAQRLGQGQAITGGQPPLASGDSENCCESGPTGYVVRPAFSPNTTRFGETPRISSCSSYGNRNFFYMFNKEFGSTGGGKNTQATGSGAVIANGLDVTVPNNPNVTSAITGRTIKAPNAAVATGLATGFSALGLPYVWGGGGSGAGPNNGCARGGGDYNSCGSEIGFDCSGLTAYVMKNAGFSVPDNSGTQRAGGTSVSWDQGLPGDIVGFPGHVAIYLGEIDGTPYILEASWVGTPIHIVPLTRSDHDSQLHRYWT